MRLQQPKLNYPTELYPVLAELPDSFFVGGCIRDQLLGLKPKDFDIEVYKSDYTTLQEKLKEHGRVDLVGKAFGVVKLTLPSGAIYDFSLARKDSKIEQGIGHKAFTIETDPNMTVKEGCARRDLTINSMAYDPRTDTIVDPYNGLTDLQNKIIRHTSPQFTEDPLRVLRVMQFVSRFDFQVAPETIELCRSIKDQHNTLPKERVGEEFFKLLTKGVAISKGLEFLEASDWIVAFPELQAQVGIPQDKEYHPEGSVSQHVGHCCDALTKLPVWQSLPERERYVYMLGTLCHDLGKPSCTKEEFKPKAGRMAIVSPGHDLAGEAPTRSLLARLNVPTDIVKRVIPLVTCHMDHLTVTTDTDIRKLAVKVYPDNIQGLALVTEADHSGRPPLPAKQPSEMVDILQRATQLNCLLNKPKAILQGRHIDQWTALKAGPAYGVLCTAAYEAQLKGQISDEPSAKTWLTLNRGKILENAKLAPPRLLGGEELKELYAKTGPELGKLHRELFELQLDGKLNSREHAIQYIKDNADTYKVDNARLSKAFPPNLDIA